MDYEQAIAGPMPPVRNEMAAGSYTGAVESGPNTVVQQLMRPAASPEEKIERRGLWEQIAQKIKSDPNLQNSMLFMGAQMMQPIAPGQSGAGHLGQALATGASAYKMGEYSQYQQQQQGAESARKERESAASVAASEATTARVRQTTGQEAELHPLNLDKTRLDLSKARTAEEVAKIERDLVKRKADIEKSIPDAALRASRLAELDKVTAEVNEAKARTKNYDAAAALSGARTAKEQAEIDALDGLSDEDKRAYFSKTGKFGSTANSAVVQQAEFWGKIYDKLPIDDSDKKGRTREQYQSYKLKQANEKSILDTYAKLAQVLDPNDPFLEDIRELVRAQVTSRKEQVRGDGKAPVAPKGEAKPATRGKPITGAGGKQYIPIFENGVTRFEEVTPGPVGGPAP